MKALITNELIDTLEIKPKRYEIRDTRRPGLILRVNPSGKLMYICEFGRGKKINIGNTKNISLSDARTIAKEHLADATKGIDPRGDKIAKGMPTFKEFIENTYAEWRIAHRKSGKSDIARLKSNFLELFENQKLSDLQSLTLEKWRAKRINDNIHPETINRDINILKAALSKAVEWQLIKMHPFAKIKAMTFDRSPKIRYLEKAELARLHAALEYRRNNREMFNIGDLSDDEDSDLSTDYLEPMVIVSLNTGARRGELFDLTWDQVDLSKRTIALLGKSQSTHYVPLNEEAHQALKSWSVKAPDHARVFCRPNGQRIVTVRRAWQTLLRYAEIENFRWHDMRHHFASWLVMSGVDLNTVRELLGHSDIKMTLRYAHLAPEHKAAAVAKLSATLK
jgi:site-specific recombinase XerD